MSSTLFPDASELQKENHFLPHSARVPPRRARGLSIEPSRDLTLTSSVLERQREIGIWRSMGANGRQIAGVFWVEGLALGLLAWVTGLILSIPLAYGFLQLLGLLLIHAPFTFDPWLFVIMLIAILAIALVASLSPTLRAVCIAPTRS